MKYTIYKTTCSVNGKFYIGKHITVDPYDAYLGSGKLLKRAITKYGIENFTKKVLFVFDNEEDMNKKEQELVTLELCDALSNYNLIEGGQGGFGYINRKGLNNAGKDLTLIAEKVALQNRGAKRPKISALLVEQHRNGARPKIEIKPAGWNHTDETKQKIREKNRNNTGNKNGAFGRRWMFRSDIGAVMVSADQVQEHLDAGFIFGTKSPEERTWRNADGSLRNR